jgi:hypothetical protein
VSLFGRLFGKDEGEVEALRARVVELEEQLAFVSEKQRQLSEQEGVPLLEYAVLRYDLQKCQRDRQVLEWHLGGWRGELKLTLRLLRRLDSEGAGTETALVVSALGFAADLRAHGLTPPGLAELEAQARELYRVKAGRAWQASERELLGLRSSTLLSAFEQWRDQTREKHAKPADGLAALDKEMEALRQALAGIHEALMPAEEDAGA